MATNFKLWKLFLAAIYFHVLLEIATVSGTPTIINHAPFDPHKDATALHAAMKGIGADVSKIISIVTKRTQQQRLKIVEEYEKLFHKVN